MKSARPLRVPVAPLLVALRGAGIERDIDISRATGLHPRTIRRARRNGELTIAAADQAAIRALNVHPHEIWGDDWLIRDDNQKAEL